MTAAYRWSRLGFVPVAQTSSAVLHTTVLTAGDVAMLNRLAVQGVRWLPYDPSDD